MGTYLNPGKMNYQMSVNSDIFVDKSEMIGFLNSVINTQQRYVSVSRPRRFGKTMAADMICAYYDREADSKELFKSLKLANADSEYGNLKWDAYLGYDDATSEVYIPNKEILDEFITSTKGNECVPNTGGDYKHHRCIIEMA